MDKIKSFFVYWFENIKQSKEGFDIVMLVAAGFFTILCAVSPFVGFPKTVEEIFPETKTTWFLGVVAGGFFVAWCFIWLPFRRHQSIIETYESTIKRIEESYETAKQSKDSNINHLQTQLKLHEEKLDDRKKRKEIANHLGNFHIRLTNRTREIKNQFYLTYTRENESAFVKKTFDETTQLLMVEIELYLLENVGGASYAIFYDKSNLKIPRSDSQSSWEFADKENFHNAVVANLVCYSENLMKIITMNSTDKS